MLNFCQSWKYLYPIRYVLEASAARTERVSHVAPPVPSQGGDIPGSSSADNWTPYKKSYLYPVSEVIAIITDRSLWRFCGANVEVLSSIVDQKSQYL